MSSIAIWYDPKNDEKLLPLEVHLNYWKIPKNIFCFYRFLDIGLFIPQVDGIKSLNVFIPTNENDKNKVEKCFSDLGGVISSDNKLLCSIFNDDFTQTHRPDEPVCEVKDRDQNLLMNIYRLEQNDYSINIDKQSKGIIIKIDISDKNLQKPYFRFRIGLNRQIFNDFIRRESPVNQYFQGLIKGHETFDLRINEIRNLDSSLIKKIRSAGNFHFSKIHLFFICCSRETFQFSHKSFNSSRRLEQEIWSKYLGIDVNKQSLLAYHWKEKNESDNIKDKMHHFNSLIKTNYERSTFLTLLVYIGLLLILNLFFKFIGTKVDSWFKDESIQAPKKEIVSPKLPQNDTIHHGHKKLNNKQQ